jgi:hypothetical protein
LSQFTMPAGPRKPHADIGRSMIWVYGDPKIGKTTFASKFPGALFMATEKGQDWVETREPFFIDSWDTLLKWANWFAGHNKFVFGDGMPIRTLVIDTVDNLHKMCQDYVCRQMGIGDPGEVPHGGGWARLTKEWERVMNGLRAFPMGMVCVSHARDKEFATKGRKIQRKEPNIGASGMRWCSSAADLICYAHIQEEVVKDEDGNPKEIRDRRCLLMHPQAWAMAGGRMVRDFGLPPLIDLDYPTLARYFPNTPLTEEGINPSLPGHPSSPLAE